MYTRHVHNVIMIKTFADKETEKIYHQIFSKKLPSSVQRAALRKLIMIDNAGCLEDLRIPPSNHLESLHGKRIGQYSIRINDQYRICFTVKENDFYHLEIVDYH
jgi:proteic killer suppression protein